MGFVANVIRFLKCKNFKNRLTFDKVTKRLKVGTFWDTVYNAEGMRFFTLANKVFRNEAPEHPNVKN